MKNNFDQIEEKEREEIAAKHKKKKMPVSGKSVFELKKIIEKKSSPLGNNNQDTRPQRLSDSDGGQAITK